MRAAQWTGLILVGAAGCSPPAVEPKYVDADAAKRGKAAAIELGCAACHDFVDIDWPKGRVGPRLHDFADQAFIAGTLPNRPNNLAEFLLNPRSHLPQSAMPAIPMTPQNARDMANWLHDQRDISAKGGAG